MDWYEEMKREILQRRQLCELCWIRPATQLHHALVHDMKRYHRELSTPENMQPVCDICHTSAEQTANSFTQKRMFAWRQMRLGYDIRAWYRNLPLKSDPEPWLAVID